MEKTNLETFLNSATLESLSLRQKEILSKQLTLIDRNVLEEQQQLLRADHPQLPSFKPYSKAINLEQEFFRKRGEELISEGKVGCILVAGGQGTRLGFNGPKGCCPFTQVKGKTLFQYFSEKLKGASLQSGYPLKMAIMTSSQNHAAIQAHFICHDYFGVQAEQIEFFKQGELPFLDLAGNGVLENSEKIACGPDGNGSCIHAFFKSPIAKQWNREGILYVNFILIDNPLADPFDPYLVGAHALSTADTTLKCIERDPDEFLGIVVDVNGKAAVIEYTEAPKDVWALRNEQNQLIYSIGNISLFCFSFSFLEEISNKSLPLHKALKKTGFNEITHAWKFERYIFDVLAFANASQVGIVPRNTCFAPIKNAVGTHSLQTAKTAVSKYDRKVIESITGKTAPLECLEIDPVFYYPTESLYLKWRGSEIPPISYIEP